MVNNRAAISTIDNANVKNLLIGRDKEVSQIVDDIKNQKSSTWLITGEAGMGKSALLDEIYRRFTSSEDQNNGSKNNTFVGYYSRKESLIAESESLIYPFRIALESLIKEIKESQHLKERIDTTLSRIKKGFLKSAKEQGKKIGLALVEDIAEKAGLKQTFEVGKDIVQSIREEKTGLQLAQGYVAEHRDEARESYIEILYTIADEFKDRNFVLMFDQFEYAGKASVDFLLNFIKLMPQQRLHVIVSFRTDDKTWSNPTFRTMYKEIQDKMIDDLGGKEINLQGLTVHDINKWIKDVRSISLPLIPDLQRIRENSAGLPIILEKWIRTSTNLQYEEISGNSLCKQITKLQTPLDEEKKYKLHMLSVLLYPLTHKMLTLYLKMDNIGKIGELFRTLEENRIFVEVQNEFSDRKFKWFRHELLQRCFYEALDYEEKEDYHEKAATFFIEVENEQQENQQQQSSKANGDNVVVKESIDNYGITQNAIAISAAYHLHMSKKSPDKSYRLNKKLGEYGSRIGDLDLAERCYLRALIDIKQIQDQMLEDDKKQAKTISEEMQCLRELASNIYYIWGRYDEALSKYHYVLQYSDKVNDPELKSLVLHNIAMVYDIKSEYEKALEMYNQSLEITKRLDNQREIGHILSNIALLYTKKGEYEKALELNNQSLKIREKIGDKKGIGISLSNISLIHHIKGEYDQALEMYNQSLEIIKRLGNQREIGHLLNNIAGIHHIKGEYEKALELYNQSLKIREKIGDQYGIGQSLNNIAMVYAIKGEYDQALEMYNQSLEITKRLDNQIVIGKILSNIALIYDKKGEYEDAIDFAAQSYEILKKFNIPDYQIPIELLSTIYKKFDIFKEKILRLTGNMIFSNLDSWKSGLQQAKDISKHLSNLSVNAAKTFEQNSREINAAAKGANTNTVTTTSNTTQQSNKKI